MKNNDYCDKIDNLQRFNLTPEHPESEAMDQDDDGAWIRFADARNLLLVEVAGKDAVIAALREDLEYFKSKQAERQRRVF